MKSVTRWVCLIGVFLVPVIPFIVTGSMFFPFITGKNFAFRIMVEVMFAAWLVLGLYDPAYRLKRSWVAVALGAFVAVMAVADAFGVNFFRSFWSNFERMEGLVTLLHLLAYFVVLASVMNAEKLWNAWWNTSVGASALMCLYGLAQIGGAFEIHQGGVRVDGTLGNATYLAVYLLFHIFITLWLLYRARQNKILAALYAAALVLQSCILYYTATRGAILGVIGGVLLSLLLVAIFGREHPRLRRASAAGILAIALLAGGFFALRNAEFVKQSPVLSRFAHISVATDSTVQSRLTLWGTIALSGFKERPVLGWGQDNFIRVFGAYYAPEMYKQEPWFDRAHNVFFDWLIAGGILGLAGYLSLFVAALVMLWKSRWTLPEKAIFTGLFAAYFFHNIFVFDNLVSYIYFITVLAFLHSTTRNSQPETRTSKSVARSEKREAGYAPIVSGCIVVVFAILFYFLNIPGITTSRELIMALQASEDPAFALQFFERSLSHHSIGREEAREQLGLAAARVVASEAPDEVKRSYVSAAARELSASVASDQGNTRPLFFLGIFLNGIGNYEDAVAVFDRALAVNPDRQIILAEKGKSLSALGRKEEALALYKYMYERSPGFEEARLRYIVAAQAAGDGGVVAEQVKLLEGLIAEDPSDGQLRFSLGVAYLHAGNLDGAIAEFRQAMILNPEVRQQSEAIIEAIEAGNNRK